MTIWRLCTMSLLLLLSTSSFFLSNYLILRITAHTLTAAQLSYAEQLNDPEVDLALFEQQRLYSADWFKYAFRLGQKQPNIALLLAQYYAEQQILDQAELWYKNIIEQGQTALSQASQTAQELTLTAVTELAVLYLQQKNYQAAQALYRQHIAEPSLLNAAIKLALQLGDLEFVGKHYLALSNSLADQKLLKQLIHYQVLNQQQILALELTEETIFNKTLFNKNNKNTCDNSVQFFATNLPDLQHSEELIYQFAKHPLADYFCFAAVKYVSITQLNCSTEPEQAISCDENIWQDYRELINSRYLAVVLPVGGANVHLGIMYLDSKDNAQVFAHELSHFIGFIDEYPLAKGHQACTQNNQLIANNIILLPQYYQGEQAQIRQQLIKLLPWAEFIAPTTPLLTKTAQGWQVGTPKDFTGKVGLFSSRTCQKNGLFAFKPVAERTQLEYFETPFPLTYLKLFEKVQAKAAFAMPSYLYNISLSGK